MALLSMAFAPLHLQQHSIIPFTRGSQGSRAATDGLNHKSARGALLHAKHSRPGLWLTWMKPMPWPAWRIQRPRPLVLLGSIAIEQVFVRTYLVPHDLVSSVTYSTLSCSMGVTSSACSTRLSIPTTSAIHLAVSYLCPLLPAPAYLTLPFGLDSTSDSYLVLSVIQ